MKLWRIEQTVNNDWDTYDSAVVAAETEEQAKAIHPSGSDDEHAWKSPYGSWARSPEQVDATLIGDAVDGVAAGVIVASFNAG